MIVREATENDISAIVDVLKASLGTIDLPLSEEIWNYKHRHNPFGKSLVLIAEENGRIAGVRAFMRWNWQKSDKIFRCFRAVDTATHPEFQGKGIFKKLTLAAVDFATTNNFDFIFNTPNDQSRPGYLKMGWEQAGKLKVNLKPNFNPSWIFDKKKPALKIDKELSQIEIERLCKINNENLSKTNQFFTPKSSDFLNWRYEVNPLQAYNVIAKNNYYIASYIKQRSKFKELRHSEIITNNFEYLRELNTEIKDLKKFFPALFSSYTMHQKNSFSFSGNFGPILTVKNLNLMPIQYAKTLEITNWAYSLGDLELF